MHSYITNYEHPFTVHMIRYARYAAKLITQSFMQYSRRGLVVVSVLATGPKDCRFEPSRGNGFLTAIQIISTSSSRMGSKARRSHVKVFTLDGSTMQTNKVPL
jgi:hypothetical protein